MVTRLQRFDFGNLRDFRAPFVATALPEDTIEDAPPPPPPPPTFSEAELEAAKAEARQAAFAEGFEAGMARAAEQAEATRQSVDTTILQLGSTLSALGQEYRHLLESESAALSQMVLMIARKVTGLELSERGAEATSSLVAQCLPAVFSKPRLTIELHPDAFNETIDRIETLLHSGGFEGELQFRVNPTIGMHDSVLDWGSGQATRSVEAIWQEIETLIAQMPLTLQLGDAPTHPEDAAMDIASEPTPPTV